jgi:hypothetical protein
MPFLSYSPGPLSQMRDYAARQGTSPTCQPPTGSLSPPPAPLTMVHEWGPRRRRPVCARTGRSTNRGGARSRRGPPFTPHPCLRTNGGCAESPLLPPLRGVGRYVPPPLAPDHTLTGKCAPPFCPGNAYALPPFVRERGSRRSHAGAWPSRLGTNRRCAGSPCPVCGAREGRCPLPLLLWQR